jgi:hypothetical protein
MILNKDWINWKEENQKPSLLVSQAFALDQLATCMISYLSWYVISGKAKVAGSIPAMVEQFFRLLSVDTE